MPAIVDVPYITRRDIQVPRMSGGTLVPVPGNRTGAMVNRPGGSTYYERARGGAIRDDYGQMGAEAAALSATAPDIRSLGYAQGQAIRDNAMKAASAQTVQHFQIREQMAEAADRRAETVKTLAELALKGRMFDAERVLKERGLALDEQQLEQETKYKKGHLKLGQDEMAARKTEGEEDRKVARERLKAEKDIETMRGFREGMNDLAERKYRQDKLQLDRDQLEETKRYNSGVLTNQQGNTQQRRDAVLMRLRGEGVLTDEEFAVLSAGGYQGGAEPATNDTRLTAAPDNMSKHDAIWAAMKAEYPDIKIDGVSGKPFVMRNGKKMYVNMSEFDDEE